MLVRNTICLLGLFFMSATLAVAVELSETTGLRLASGGNTSYTIVHTVNAHPAEIHAVQELADHLGKVTGAKFSIATDAKQVSGPRIIVGPGKMSIAVLGKKVIEDLSEEEYIIRTIGHDLLLVGGRPRGTLYAVYDFLDSIVGVRWWAPGATHIPRKPDLTVQNLNIKKKPFFEYRDVMSATSFVPDWAARNRLNGRVYGVNNALSIPSVERGGGLLYNAGFVHTFDAYVPAQELFDDHPEWFSLIDGKRVGGQHAGQLCLTNSEVLDYMVKQVKAELMENPRITIASVSQNDNMKNCQCADCKKIDEEEGTPMGSLLQFVNAVAERIEKEHPNVYIDTLAYQYTRKPPKSIRPRHNVLIRLCSIECSFAQPLDSPQNKAFAEDVSGWAAITDRIYIWDYIANYSNYFMPHPNLHVLGPNLRFFARNKVKGYFAEGSFASFGLTPSGEMEELRAWVLSRLLQDPYQDDKALIDEFVKGYYGRAAGYISEYINLIHDMVAREEYYLTCSGGRSPRPHITMEVMHKAQNLFQRAEAAVADQPDILNRVRRAHMPVQLMWATHYDTWAVEVKEKGYKADTFEYFLTAFERQVEVDKVTRFNHGSRTMANYLGTLRHKDLSKMVRSSIGDRPWEIYDGNPDTRWEHHVMGPVWFQKDFGKKVRITSINTSFGTPSIGLSYKIEGSDDGINFEVLITEREITSGERDDLFDVPVEVRFVRTTLLKTYEPYSGVIKSVTEQVIVTE